MKVSRPSPSTLLKVGFNAITVVCLIGAGVVGQMLWYQHHTDTHHTTNIVTTEYRLRGDVNLDGTVNDADTAIIRKNWSKEKPTYEDGDLNEDGKIDDKDLAIVLKWQGNGNHEFILISV